MFPAPTLTLVGEASFVSVPARVRYPYARQFLKPPARGHWGSLPPQGGPWRRRHKPVPSTLWLLHSSPGVIPLPPPSTTGPTPRCRPRFADGPSAPSLSKLQALSRPAPPHPRDRLSPRVRGPLIPLEPSRVLQALLRTIPPHVSRSSSSSWTLGQHWGHLKHALLSFTPQGNPLGRL